MGIKNGNDNMKRDDVIIVKKTALPADYGRWIQTVKDRVRAAQLRTMIAVNVEQLLLYWDIGHDILERQKNEGCAWSFRGLVPVFLCPRVFPPCGNGCGNG